MSKTELKVIRAAIRSTRDLIQTLNDGREMPDTIREMFYALNRDACILSEMIEDEVKEVDGAVGYPRKTRQNVFLERYPEADVLNLCPKWVDNSYSPCEGCAYTKCADCEKEYWMQEV